MVVFNALFVHFWVDLFLFLYMFDLKLWII